MLRCRIQDGLKGRPYLAGVNPLAGEGVVVSSHLVAVWRVPGDKAVLVDLAMARSCTGS